jgi:hypothetical protein
VRQQLAGYGTRPWQVNLVTLVLVSAIVSADEEPEEPADPAEEPGSDDPTA